ncbi:MAG: ATP-grasp domain-containing protein [Acidobacteria bacterium]|nr:ATP-grasp domain-containing protein [Acidobacteriota bacterium]
MKNADAKLLLLSTTSSYETRLFVEAAERLSIPLLFGTDRCHRLDDPWQDGALPLRFEEPEASAGVIVEQSRTQSIQAIVPLGDRAVRTAALACQALGLSHNPPSAAEACRNKFIARQRLQAAGLWVPPFARFSIYEDPRPRLDEMPFPCVLKPLSLSASQGVIRANGPEEFLAAFERIARLLRQPDIQVLREETLGELLVEGFIPGPEFALEGLLDHGRLRVLVLFDKPDPLEGPYFEETLYVTPSRLPEAKQREIIGAVEAAAKALTLCHGPIHAEVRLPADGPRVLEVAARAIGGLCSRAVRFQTGISLPELILRHAWGLPIEPVVREDAAAGVMMIPIPQAGIFHGVEGLEEARQVPGIEDIAITAKPAHPIVPLPEGASYLGFIFARDSSSEAVERALREAHGRLRFRIGPELPVV